MKSKKIKIVIIAALAAGALGWNVRAQEAYHTFALVNTNFTSGSYSNANGTVTAIGPAFVMQYGLLNNTTVAAVVVPGSTAGSNVVFGFNVSMDGVNWTTNAPITYTASEHNGKTTNLDLAVPNIGITIPSFRQFRYIRWDTLWVTDLSPTEVLTNTITGFY